MSTHRAELKSLGWVIYETYSTQKDAENAAKELDSDKYEVQIIREGNRFAIYLRAINN